MILGLSVRDGKLLMAVRQDDDTRFHQIDIDLSDRSESFDIRNIADDDIRKLFDESKLVALGIPASACFTKRIEIDKNLSREKEDYLRWRAGIQLPGGLDKYEYGFVPVLKRFDSVKTEVLFYAMPRGEMGNILSVFGGALPEFAVIVPEQLALVEVLRKSISKDDIDQAAIVNIENDRAVAVFLKDNRYHHSRCFSLSDSGPEELSSDIETYLLTQMSHEEDLPLVVIGTTDRLKLNWPSIAPVFLSIHDLDYAISWGLSEVVAAGGRCELSEAN